MVDIRYRCCHCAAKLSIPEAAAGMEIRCPHCHLTCAVPQPGAVGRLLSIDMRFRCPACDKKMSVDADHAGMNWDGVIWKMTEEQWDKVIEVDLKGTFNFIRAVSPLFREQKSGKIIKYFVLLDY